VTATGGSPVDLTLKARMQATFGLPFGNGYGMTEMTPIARVPDHMEASGDEIGIPAPGCGLRVMREDGTEAAPGEIGELWARGPSRMDGYFRDPEATAATVTREGWLRTGDLGMRDARGAFTIVGRSKELIIRSGFNVYPVEVEGVLNAFPGVAQSAVVGRRVPGNEEVVAYVQPAAGAALDAAALRAHCRANLAGYKVPSEIVLCDLPIGPTGKILKSALARRAAA
jgi:acyl-CoA synthetase (AMP-forming)/AMP-acid ligase II